MEKDTLKNQVLAKCGDAKNGKIQWLKYGESELPLRMFEDSNGRRYFQIGWNMFAVTLQFREDTHEDSIAWPLAAKILGIEDNQAKKDRNDLLWGCWLAACAGDYPSGEEKERDYFNEWLEEMEAETTKPDNRTE